MVAALASSCAAPANVHLKVKGSPRLEAKQYVSYDNDRFGYRKWLPLKGGARMVVIGVHGISGYSGDYENLGKHLQRNLPGVALYAAETRGQGMDVNFHRRGDIRSVKEWYKDLYTFTRLVRKVHPKARIVWFGESMGSLIIMHAYRNTPPGERRPDAMVISSPIVDVEEKLPAWKLVAVRVTAMLMPRFRVSLESLSEGERPVVTKQDIHEEQAAKNPWYIRRYTLRLLLNLGDMATKIHKRAEEVRCPVLLLHGGKDIFARRKSVDRLFGHFPDGIHKTHRYYPDSFHLLMYDHEREKVFRDVVRWLKELEFKAVSSK